MDYVKHPWVDYDPEDPTTLANAEITAEKMNEMENGIYAGNAFYVNFHLITGGLLEFDKTVNEILQAIKAGKLIVFCQDNFYPAVASYKYESDSLWEIHAEVFNLSAGTLQIINIDTYNNMDFNNYSGVYYYPLYNIPTTK